MNSLEDKILSSVINLSKRAVARCRHETRSVGLCDFAESLSNEAETRNGAKDGTTKNGIID
jgi:hypothetical protein